LDEFGKVGGGVDIGKMNSSSKMNCRCYGRLYHSGTLARDLNTVVLTEAIVELRGIN
jgi:hypothetical protein